MKIAIIGATGYVGSKILKESLARDHDVTAIGRELDALPTHERLTPVQGDATKPDELASFLAGHDAVISAFSPVKDASGTGMRSIVDAVKRAGVERLLVVGGAGSLEIAPGRRVIDEPDFPAVWKDGAAKTAEFLDLLRGEAELDWVFVTPAKMLAPGTRTGAYRVGGDQLMTDGKGESHISLEDYAVAMIDEVERPEHHRQRFSVAY